TIAHKLKGSALSLHCKPLADCCAKLERAAPYEASSILEVMLEELRDILRDTLLAIESWAI
ncbi:MAG: Hpt domain-containing protein, partial [Pseudomonadales bacterium]|nr:Hpt domain-containing protein [Pseudomonadales bacterium]